MTPAEAHLYTTALAWHRLRRQRQVSACDLTKMEHLLDEACTAVDREREEARYASLPGPKQ